MKKPLNIKFMVYISEKYFINVYGEKWFKIKAEIKEQLRGTIVHIIDKFLSGIKLTETDTLRVKDKNGNWLDGIEVKEI